METRRVVITGMGAVTPLGNNVSAFWQALRDGRNGIAPITKVDVSDSPVKLAGEVRGFDPRDFMDFKLNGDIIEGIFKDDEATLNCIIYRNH